MTPDEINGIKKRAKEVNDISMQYQLAHAIFACERLAGDVVKKYCEEKITELKNQAAKPNLPDKEIERIRKERDILLKKSPFRIYVDYIQMAEDGARVIWLDDINQMSIQMPQILLNNALDETTRWYKTAEAVKILRRTKAHELGHIALSIEWLLNNANNLQGTKNLVGKNEEAAKIFAEELLKLRHERNKKLQQDLMLKEAF